METFFQSFLLVAVSEMGDKTQLLAIVLTAKFRKPWTIFFGILGATLLNHWLAAFLGETVSTLISPNTLKWILFALFISFAFWILIPDKDEELKNTSQMNAFFTTLVLFFLAEMGDKTQLATIALGAHFKNYFLVTLGTTLGMMLSNGLAIFFGNKVIKRISMTWVRRLAALLFMIFAIAIVMI